MRELGCNQQGVLDSLQEHGYWREGCGWVWKSDSVTVKALTSLVKRGLVTVEQEKTRAGKMRDVFRLARSSYQNWWTVVNDETGEPVIPMDSNRHEDQGVLAYRSYAAAVMAAEHQSEMYDLKCSPAILATLS